jgi:copper chaperone CopZ
VSETVTYSVPDVSCDHCATAIRGELQSVAGVESVDEAGYDVAA